jgi:hypothetical protein
MQVFINSSKITCFDDVYQSCFAIYNDDVFGSQILETEFMFVMTLCCYSLPFNGTHDKM